VFLGLGENGQHGIYQWSDGLLELIVNTDTEIPGEIVDFSNLGFLSFDNGAISFSSSGPTGQDAIYTDLGGALVEMISVSDTLDGKQLSWVGISRQGLSEETIVFGARFSDGSEGIYMALLVPEPSTGAVLAAGLLVVGLARRLP